jgi:hypothetical protein
MNDCAVLKASGDEDRFLLVLAYPANRADVSKAIDGHRDFAPPRVVEKAAWRFLLKGAKVGRFHADARGGTGDPGYGTTGTVVETSVYRGPDWTLTAADGSEQVIKAGDWLVGMILTPEAWDLYKAGQIRGASPQGTARRTKPSAEALANLRS